MLELRITSASIGRWDVPVIRFVDELHYMAMPVLGHIANSIYTSQAGRSRLIDWKRNIVGTVKACRGANPFDPSAIYAVSIAFSFCPQAHGNRPLDVENFVKPTVDALAAGLFCANEQNVSAIERYDYDDSNFRYLFVHKTGDAQSPECEGVAFGISIRL